MAIPYLDSLARHGVSFRLWFLNNRISLGRSFEGMAGPEVRSSKGLAPLGMVILCLTKMK